MLTPKSMTRKLLVLLLLSTLAAGALWKTVTAGPKRLGGPGGIAFEPTASFQEPQVSLEGGVDWINSKPISIEELRGKVVLLDFWTYCCINCHHVLPDLAKLEQKYKNELVVIGVHTPKFFAEQETENIRQKVHEYQIKHPVINDANQVLWNRFHVNSWPTLALISPDGEFHGSVSGEGKYALLDRAIGRLVAEYTAKGELNTAPFKFFPESEKPDRSPLSYPGKVLADEKGKRLFVADTAHNRIVQSDLKGNKPVAIGGGSPGLVDGDYAKAEFNRPQGMCLVEETLYVADTENHAIRAIDLEGKTVSTVAGTGQQSHLFKGSGLGRKTALSSPWDVILIPGTKTLAIAMAGIHEIWRYDIPSGVVGHWAGTGEENIEDGPVASALFAQPSGLATDGHFLYVADSEVSAIRAISLDKRKHFVQTVVGSGLFAFDDVDGRGPEVRLQHCLGLAFGHNKLYIADTYNNKIKVCDPHARSVETLIGNRQHGKTDDPPRFYQPGGLSIAGWDLYVADTNNNKVRVVDLKQGTVTTLEFEGLKPPAAKGRVPTFANAVVKDLMPVKVGPGKSFTFEVTLPLAAGVKLNEEAPMPTLVESPEKPDRLAGAAPLVRRIDPPSRDFTVAVELAKPAEPGDSFALKLSVGAFVCNENSNVCMVKNFVWNIPVRVVNGGEDRVSIAEEAKGR